LESLIQSLFEEIINKGQKPP